MRKQDRRKIFVKKKKKKQKNIIQNKVMGINANKSINVNKQNKAVVSTLILDKRLSY